MAYKLFSGILMLSSLLLLHNFWILSTNAERNGLSRARELQQDDLDFCLGAPCPANNQCRNPQQGNQCGDGPNFCNELSSWNSTGCQLLSVDSGEENSTEVNASTDVGAAVGGVFGALAFMTVGTVMIRKRNLLKRRPKIIETPWTPEETAAFQRAYDFTKDFDSLCKAVPTKTPGEIAIKLKKTLQPRNMLQRASMMLFTPRESLGFGRVKSTRKGPLQMISAFKSSALVQTPLSYIPSRPLSAFKSSAFMQYLPSKLSRLRPPTFPRGFAFWRGQPKTTQMMTSPMQQQVMMPMMMPMQQSMMTSMQQPMMMPMMPSMQQPMMPSMQQPMMMPMMPSMQQPMMTSMQQGMMPPMQQPMMMSLQQPMMSSPMQQSMMSSPMQQSMMSSPMQQSMMSSPMQQSMMSSPMQQSMMSSPMQQSMMSSSIQQPMMMSMQQPMMSSQMQQPMMMPMQQSMMPPRQQPMMMSPPSSKPAKRVQESTISFRPSKLFLNLRPPPGFTLKRNRAQPQMISQMPMSMPMQQQPTMMSKQPPPIPPKPVQQAPMMMMRPPTYGSQNGFPGSSKSKSSTSLSSFRSQPSPGPSTPRMLPPPQSFAQLQQQQSQNPMGYSNGNMQSGNPMFTNNRYF